MSIYKQLSGDELDELLSNFLIDAWSYSKVASFARNEKAFEMQYIFNTRPRSSATTVAGSAYHAALEAFFYNKQRGNTLPLVDLEIVAFEYIEEVKGNDWKLQKTTPTVEDCKKKAISTVTALLKNFYSEISTYEVDTAKIIDVEVKGQEFLTVNGVDVPLPCNFRIDLVLEAADGKTVVVDHKSKAAYTSDDEVALTIGNQAIIYVKAYEAMTGKKVDEVWFVENKYSQNKDKSPQLNAFKVQLNDDTRKLYEALLYEPLRRMISAVNDPDYVYMINDADNLVDRAELYDFWAKTMICEVEDFNIADAKKDLISKRLKKVRDASLEVISPKVIREFKRNAASFIQYDLSHTNMTQAEKIEHVLRTFSLITKVAYHLEGFSSDTYLLEVSAGVKISAIASHRLDMANALDVANVRVSSNLVMHEGKSYLAIDVSKKRDRDLLFDPAALTNRRIPIGKDNYNNVVVWDADNHSTPHVLVCGATGSGKSVSVKSTMDYALLAGFDEVVILDPKYEFTSFRSKPNVSVYNEIIEIEEKMRDLVIEMNELVKQGKKKMTLVVFDEFADALAQARKGKALDIYELVEVGEHPSGKPKYAKEQIGRDLPLEENLRILLQKGRSSGYRVIAATQRASVKVITGDAKVNFPVQICFRVPKEADSRVVLDEAGAESLAGMGDGLIKSPEYPELVRFQAYYSPETVYA